ncbi:ROK family transcriptional regulator [Ktedonobacter robiniae]|uniref:Transcriptional regulator n=1 Tax=Ktedonobacter robiniae TaxID=2778365 RepID=A0ABQ3V4N7_9CHLR|nr:ROK family transcriptional regulator [Ktedonobacter robiniae]GHO59926.1 transcriptional regulator [Ktedonobacter robiniae]
MTSFLEIPAVPGSLRQMNRLTVLRLLRKFGPITKPALAEYSGISRPTITKLVDELEEQGLAECVGIAAPTASGGKPGALYRFNAEGVQSAGVFLTVDTVRVALVNGNGRVLGRLECPLGLDRRPEPVINAIVETLQELLASLHVTLPQLLGIGVGMPGLTSFATGVVHFAPHFPQWQDVPVRDLLKARLGIEVWVDNDCHVQALAERHFGAGQSCTDFVSVESGIGVSAAFYLQDTLYRGVGGTAGEIGHMTIQEDGPLCECGNRGCWETLAATTWMVEQACQSGQATWLPLPTGARVENGAMTTREPDVMNTLAHAIFRAAQEGHPEAIDLVRQHAMHFGVGLATIINTLNPQCIIIWGDSMKGGNLFLETVRAVVRQRALGRPRDMCTIIFSSFVQDVGVIGAASLVIDALFTYHQPAS